MESRSIEIGDGKNDTKKRKNSVKHNSHSIYDPFNL